MFPTFSGAAVCSLRSLIAPARPPALPPHPETLNHKNNEIPLDKKKTQACLAQKPNKLKLAFPRNLNNSSGFPETLNHKIIEIH